LRWGLTTEVDGLSPPPHTLTTVASNAVVYTSEINHFKIIIISAFVDVRLGWFYFSAWKLDWNYFNIISEPAGRSSRIFINTFNVAEIILEVF